MEALLLSLIGALAVNLSTYIGKLQKGEKFNWGKALRTIVIGAVLGLVGASADGAAGLNPATYIAASAGVTTVLDQGIKAVYRWVGKRA